MFTLFTVSVQNFKSAADHLEPKVTVDNGDVMIFGGGRLAASKLYRISEIGYFGWIEEADSEAIVLYCKLDDQPGLCLMVTADGEYRFGRLIGSFVATGDGFHDGQWEESEAAWGWLTAQDAETETLVVPDYVREKLALA